MIEKAYLAKNYEDDIYAAWEKSGLFSPKIRKGSHPSTLIPQPFVIMMPPPNATGTLHLGHAIMLAIEDIMVRYHRMNGEPALWLPGTDHASIATQNKVEKILAEKGQTRHSLGREEFLKRVNEFVKESQGIIRKQIRKMGASCDWSRERYTLEPMLSRAVRRVFVDMYNDGLIYRGNRIVNWCPRCASTLADDEVEYREEKTKFYYFRYGPFVIGTARPETKFQDKIIVVHPDDKRYQKYIGEEMMVPWIEGDVKSTILADKSVDMEFGTGAMTITPAHDFNDFEIAKRMNLDIVQIIDEKGNLTQAAGSFAGKSARGARDAIVAKLQEKRLVEKIDENYVHNISLCYRCDTPVEPLTSKQWFIAVDKPFGKRKKSLKELAIDAVRSGKTKILPERFQKTYFQWMENLHDWCISRQIWFGHQIPVWYCIGDETEGAVCKIECRKPYVQTDTPSACVHCGSKNLRQDPDTLDTWFSSALWTFSTLGWPEKTLDLKYFHPTTVLETGYDILFFWVARMILMTQYALHEIPFKYVYLHGLVRTREGKKMSKSNPETCIDPLDMIEKYGTDSLRLSMLIGSGPGNDIRLYEEKIAGFRNFVNKIWNATRFSLLQSGSNENRALLIKAKSPTAISLADKWILTRTQELIHEVTEDIENFRFSEAGTKIYDFAWGEYCAWYLEISKGEHKNTAVLEYVLETILKLLHPFVPFVTEALWKHLDKKTMLMAESWPKLEKKFIFKDEAENMSVVIQVITAIRNLRHEHHIDPAKKIHAVLISKKWQKLLEEKRESLMRLARLEKLNIETKAPEVTHHPVLSQFISGVEILLPLGELVDSGTERKRLQAQKENLEQYMSGINVKLSNPHFKERAPAHIIEAEKAKIAATKEKLGKIEKQLSLLQ